MVELNGITRMPPLETFIKVEFHEVSGYGREGHEARPPTNGVIELENLIEP